MVVSTYSLKPYTANLNNADRLHFLRRTLCGVGHRELYFFEKLDMEAIITVLLKPTPIREMFPQEDPDLTDPLVPNGKMWVNAPYENNDIDKKRRIYLRGWWVGQLLNSDMSISEKMILFLHNHFATEFEVVKDARYSYRYIRLLQRYALGNYKDFLKEGSSNIAMLVYLNGNTNTKEHPNENYGRELLELFTLGKERGVHYSETDVKMAARVLSGWKDDKESINTHFVPELHDTGDKEFSSHFNNYVIKGRPGMAGALEKDELIDIIFSKKETAIFIVRNLYKYFVCDMVDEKVEQDIIWPLADIFIQNNFELVPVLRTLLTSEHFFDLAFRGSIVKNPVDFFIGATKQFGLNLPESENDCHLCWIHYAYYLEALSMNIGDPPSVAGWQAYHQAPKYTLWWINSYTLSFRSRIIDSLSSDEGLNCNGPTLKFDFLAFAARFKGVGEIDTFIAECEEFLSSVPFSENSKAKLREILISGQENGYYWKQAWANYSSNPNDEKYKSVIKNRLTLFFNKIVNLPEFQMI